MARSQATTQRPLQSTDNQADNLADNNLANNNLDGQLASAPNMVFASTALDPEQKARELQRIVGSLIDILDRENDLIIHKPLVNFDRLKSISVQKKHLFEEYHGFLATIGSLKNLAGDLNDAMRENLKSMFSRYEKAAETNERRLTVALKISAKILDAVSSEQSNNAPVLSYNQHGRVKKPAYQPLGFKHEI